MNFVQIYVFLEAIKKLP